MNFLAVKGPELFSKWVGESEKAIHALFQRARSLAPCVVFFDEVDAIGGKRGDGSGSGSVTDRVLSQLLLEMDGVTPLSRVVVVAATNRPDALDAAFLRPGRIDRMVFVPPPDAAGRLDIFTRRTRPVSECGNADKKKKDDTNMQKNDSLEDDGPDTRMPISSDVSLQELVDLVCVFCVCLFILLTFV